MHCIDRMIYPIESARTSSLRHRRKGLGVSGLHGVFMRLKLVCDAPEAKKLNKLIFETIYRAAVLESSELARVKGGTKLSPARLPARASFSLKCGARRLFLQRLGGIRKNMVRYGLRNSLLMALMPTVSCASIASVTESFEILTSNLYSRKIMAGEHSIVYKYMMWELVDLGLRNKNLPERLLSNNGSIQLSKGDIPADVCHRYGTVWEYKMRD
ncbi:Ribonucleoside-diphosphate reductase large subunit [Hondaea fermentalgiana]|uniref:Ribonucleoside-diphosphate reductase large subunit n=1 Tax=Hondaea fermentalgiana TaxID=2315210 RepID=A0A2R5GSI9_9STRA|nr:Ribonucleoside-diphosphate reductase large subunit [Hondaea fermentalgiana]|eukprot:GBG30844.1 Ribonucleoside-diphosphate reductase large subunit [Hondaea fermentalgiana]